MSQERQAIVRSIGSRADVEAIVMLAGAAELPAVVIDPQDWQSIPAENLVAAFQVKRM